MAGTGLFRTDQVKFAFEEESVEGQAESTINTSMGIIKSGIELPDVEYAWDAFFGVGREGRARKDIHEGAQTFRGSISQIYLLFNDSREILSMCLGEHSDTIVTLAGTNPGVITGVTTTTMTDSGEDFSAGDLDVKSSNHAVFSGISIGYIDSTVGSGIAEVTVYPTPARSGTKGWNGPQPTVGDDYEIRKTVSVGTSTGNKLTVPTQRLKSMTWAVQHRNAFNHGAGSVGSNLTVNYLGGKVNRATLSAVQGEKVSLALDEVLFRDLRHDSALPNSSVPKYSASTVTPSAIFPTEAPLEYSEGTIALFELTNTFARIRNFSLVIDNQLEDSRYIATVAVDGGTKISQIPFEFIEGPILVTLECEAVMETREYWEHLMRQGLNDGLSSKTGFDIRLQFRPDAAAAESFYIQAPPMTNPVQTDITGASGDIFSTTAQSATTNIGAVLIAAPHVIGTEGENLIVVRLRFDLPSVMLWWQDS
ncbi:hypothetical protein LCGC14_0263890 [marine sediment metagenome]|uniref:Uncharacterized protein n=1 Tax=marine sediment metagenome TaxID=412755 RepID=A0A0F9U0U0_9ZZZZ